jgi:hypothetical protein
MNMQTEWLLGADSPTETSQLLCRLPASQLVEGHTARGLTGGSYLLFPCTKFIK